MRRFPSSPMRGSRPWRLRRSERFPAKALRPGLELLEDRTLLNSQSLLNFQSLVIDPGTYDSSVILVRFLNDDSATVPDGLTVGRELPLVDGLHEVHLPEGMSVDEALALLQDNGNVLYAQPNYRVHIALTPNDPLYPQQFALNNTGQTGGTPDADIDAPEAWDIFTGSASTIVAVIDTGVDYTHPDLAANIWVNSNEVAGNGVDDDNNGFIDDIHGYDFVNNDGDPLDDHGHGTHVAGTIGAVTNNGIGVAGIAWNVKIMAVKFLDANGGGSLTGAIDALNYAVANGATISNNSWGGGGFYQPLRDAIASAAQQDHIFVAAAGNDSNNNDLSPAYPASYDLDNIISVAAVDHNDQLASFSNYGAATVDIGAPGVAILSTVPTAGALGDPSGYKTLSGTSMATPHVSGVVALVRGLHPTWSYSQVISQVLGTADPIAALDGKTVTGGRLNAYAALTGTPPPDTTGPYVITTNLRGSTVAPVSTLRVTFNESIDPATFTPADIVSFTGPNGAIAVTDVSAVASTSNRQFEISFAPQSDLGAYQLVFGPNLTDAAGNLMNQDRDAINGEDPADRYTASFTISEQLVFSSTDVPASLPWLTAVGSTLTVDQDVTIGDLNLTLNISHPFGGDLALYVYAPDGSYAFLSIFNGSGANFNDTTFDDEADVPITGGDSPFAGSYRPESALAVFDGLNARGSWELWVENWGFFDGVLNSWSITITPGDSNPPPPPPPSNNPPVASDDTATTDEDVAVVVDVLSNDSDPDGDSLQVVSIDNVFGGTAVINADQTVSFTPHANFNGSAYFGYTISDGQATASATAWISVNPINDAPTAASDQAVATRDTALYLSRDNLIGNDVDVDGDWLYITSVSNASHGTAELQGDGGVLFTPEADYSGWASFDYTLSDGQLTATATVTIDVQALYYFSTTAGGTLRSSDGSSLSFTSADILSLTVSAAGTYKYQMAFDGSDVGLTTSSENIDAFAFLGDGSILISTVGGFSVPGVSGSGEDLLRFFPSSLGTVTSGSWSLYFDGSDVGLSGSAENVDAVAVLADGRVLISIAGSGSVSGVSLFQDEDLLAFTPTSLGTTTTGRWAWYFDGSDVGLASNNNEDVDALFVKPSDTGGLPTLYFSTVGAFGVAGLSGADEDVFAFKPTSLGSTTAGSFGPSLILDGSTYGLGAFNIDGIHVGSAAPLVFPASSGFGTRSFEPDMVEVDAERTPAGGNPSMHIDIFGPLNTVPASGRKTTARKTEGLSGAALLEMAPSRVSATAIAAVFAADAGTDAATISPTGFQDNWSADVENWFNFPDLDLFIKPPGQPQR